MDPNSPYYVWYQGDGQDDTGIAKDAFISVKKHFRESNSLRAEERALLEGSSSIEDVHKVVASSLAKYETRVESSKPRKWLQRCSEMICHYSTVLDVFAQHHPEYVSLVWGSVKVLFISAVNHGETLKLLSKSLVQVAQRLPQVEILSTLYPTKQIRLAVETLYAGILEFLLIAHSWCKESKFSHFYHSFTRPHELHYNELLERISDCSNSINELANIGSHSEIRVMHKTQASKLDEIIAALQASENDRKNQLDGLNCAVSRLEASHANHEKKLDIIIYQLEASGLTINDLLTKIETFHSIQTSAQLDTNQQLSDVQLCQALSTFTQSFEDPDRCYQDQLRLRNRRACGKGRTISTNEFWLSPRLASCAASQGSSIAIIKGSFNLRSAIQDFGVDVIQTLVSSTTPTLWVLAGTLKPRSKSKSTSTDLVKNLTYQALRLHGPARTEKQMSIRYSQLQTARGLGEWLDLFKQVIGTLGGHVHLVVDLAVAHASLEGLDGANFIHELNKRLGEMSQQGNGTTVKIFLLVYEAEWFRLIPDELSGNTIAVKAAGGRRQQSKEMKRAVNKRILSTSVRRQKCRA
ncbi:hypothetical protein FDECE_950 [Fusarium decemcellulare]|nr:hypothetical protein FDECE_950 [Fusarium decemcellulare]